jgi:hypothetical protein
MREAKTQSNSETSGKAMDGESQPQSASKRNFRMRILGSERPNFGSNSVNGTNTLMTAKPWFFSGILQHRMIQRRSADRYPNKTLVRFACAKESIQKLVDSPKTCR